MIFDVYDLGNDWRNADPVAALRTGRRADVHIKPRFPSSPHDNALIARFYEPGSQDEALPPLHYVTFARSAMNSHSMLLEGTVMVAERPNAKSKVNHFRVAYLCKFPGAPAVLNTEKMQQRRAALRKQISADPFHPAHDNIDNSYGPLDDSIT